MTIIDEVVLAAKEIFKNNKVLQKLCIVQAIHESNLYNHPSSLAVKFNNLFGIKKEGTHGYVKLDTFEYINGKKVIVKALFGYNNSIIDSVKQYAKIIDLPRYKKVKAAKSFEEAALEIVKGGYATDPNYTKKLLGIISDSRFPQL